MLTASGRTEDLVEGLRIGADDYLGKPFAFAELVARTQVLGRRAPPAPRVLERAGIRIDTGRRVVTRDDAVVELTPKEFSVLEELLLADGNVVSAEELLARAWTSTRIPSRTPSGSR